MSSEYPGYRNGHSAGSSVQYRHKTRRGKVPVDQGLSNGLIILVIAIVVGCFAVLWPKYFYPMLFGESQHQPKFDPETMFMSGAHGREYLNNKMKERGHPGVHPGTGDPARARMTPPIRTADGPLPGMRAGMGGQVPPIQQEKGRGAVGYLMPIYTVGIIILFVYTAMKLMFKKKKEEEEDVLESRRFNRQMKSRMRGSTGGVGGEPKYDEEYYNNLIRQQQLNTGSRLEDVRKERLRGGGGGGGEGGEGGEGDITSDKKTEEVGESPGAAMEQKPQNTEQSNEKTQDQKDIEIILLKARLEQTEKTLQRLIGQMGAITTGLAGAGVDVGSLETQEDTSEIIDEEDLGEEEEEDSDGDEEEVYDENFEIDSDDEDDDDNEVEDEEEEDISE